MDDFRIKLERRYGEVFSRPLLDAIVKEGQLFHFKRGETLISFGSYIKMMPLLLEGSIKISRQDDSGNELLLYYLGTGDACSMSFSCCTASKKSEFQAIAEEDALIIGLPPKIMEQWMGQFSTWRKFVLNAYDQRMTEIIQTIDSIAFKKMDERLWEYLIAKSNTIQRTTINATHQTIANDLNASREAISRLLKKLEHQGKIKLGRNEIEMLSR